MQSRLEGQVILITGASGGIGAATARLFAEEGARLILHYHRNEIAATKLRDAVEPDAIAVQADLRDEAEVEAMYDAALRHFERIDGIVVNAGVWPDQEVPLQHMTLERWRNTLDTDLTGAFLTCRGFLQHLEESPREHASIVLVGSTAAMFGEAMHADYAAAKAGLVYGLTRSLKNEIVRLAPLGRVNAVCPGWTSTPMAASGLEDESLVDRVMSTMPLQKIGQPEDMAAAIVFLTSGLTAGHITGAVLPVAGGMEGRLLRPVEDAGP